MKISFLGAAHEVTGSCTLLEACGKKILIDCGMEQGADIYENCEMPVDPGVIDAVFLTHSHIDHAGRLPMLTVRGYTGPIYATRAAAELCNIMLLDSAHIQESEAEWRNRKNKRSGADPYVPLYTTQDAKKCLEQFVPHTYLESFPVCDGITARFRDAGHLIGSASIELTVTENGKTKILLFSGDLGNVERPLIRDPQKPEKADIVVIESTYGDRHHGPRRDYLGQLTRVVQETLDRGGNVVIPCFAVGRTQEFLYLLREIKRLGLVKGHDGFPVYVDSPLAVEATKIYDGDLMDFYDDQTLELLRQGVDVLHFCDLHLSITANDSKAINEDKTPKVILSASGMCEAGRIRHHLKHNLWRPESSVLFVGYQSEGTMGRMLQDGAKTVRIFSETIKVAAKIEAMDGISGHGDQKIMLDWLGALQNKPAMVFVNHGEDGVCDTFAQVITEKLGFASLAPYNGAVYDLDTLTCLDEGNRARIVKKPRKSAAEQAFERLMEAGKRLMELIEASRGRDAKVLTSFRDQINNLCNKFDR